MKRALMVSALLIAAACPVEMRAETETIDLKALAKKARPAVMLLVVSDANGKEIATGTGFLVSSDGKLITNHHVIEGAASAVAKSENGGLYPVEGVLASDPKNDLVLLKLKGKDLPFLTLGKSENIEVGTRIAVIGSPLGLEGTLSEGIVSAVRELMGNIRKLQITAAISPGSSGSPVMNSKGDVVGIAAALVRGGQSLNLAVPVECANQLLAKAKLTAMPQTFEKSTSNSDDAIYSDPDWRAACAAEADGNNVEQLKRNKVLVARYPDNATAWLGLGITFGKLDFPDDAITAYRQAIKIKPDYTEAWCNMGVTYGKSGHTDEAIAAYRQAIKIKPDDADSWYNLGVNYEKSGRTDEAIAAFRQAIKIKPDDAASWCNLGFSYRKSGRIDDAIVAYRQAIKIEPDYALAWFNLGRSYSDSRRTGDEIAAYRQAIKIKQDFAEAWYNLSLAYRESGRIEEAAEARARAMQLKPDLFK